MAKFKRDEIYIEKIVQNTINYHSHDFFELAYIKEGEINHYLNGKEYRLSAGDYFIIDVNSRHTYTTVSNQPCRLYNCLFYAEAIDKCMKHCNSFNGLIENYLIKFNMSILKFNPTAYIFKDKDGHILSLLDRIYKEKNNRFYGYNEIMRCYLIDILISTMRNIADYDKIISNNSPTEFVIKAINSNFNKNITLSDIAKDLNYSLPYISAKFKNDTGYSFTEYLQKHRIENSLRLLSNSSMKIIEVAYSVGYDDVNFFGYLFKKYMNVTPSKYRKMSWEQRTDN